MCVRPSVRPSDRRGVRRRYGAAHERGARVLCLASPGPSAERVDAATMQAELGERPHATRGLTGALTALVSAPPAFTVVAWCRDYAQTIAAIGLDIPDLSHEFLLDSFFLLVGGMSESL